MIEIKKHLSLLVLSTLCLFLLFSPVLSFADTGSLVPCNMGECTLCDVFQLFVNVVGYLLLYIVPFIATFLFLYGGINFYLSGGEPEKVSKGREIITHTLIGILIIYGAWVIVNSFLMAIGVADGWQTINCEITEPEE